MWPNPQEMRIWSHLLKKSLLENFIFCAVKVMTYYKKLQPLSHETLSTRGQVRSRDKLKTKSGRMVTYIKELPSRSHVAFLSLELVSDFDFS